MTECSICHKQIHDNGIVFCYQCQKPYCANHANHYSYIPHEWSYNYND